MKNFENIYNGFFLTPLAFIKESNSKRKGKEDEMKKRKSSLHWQGQLCQKEKALFR